MRCLVIPITSYIRGLQFNLSLHCKYYGEEELNERIVNPNSFSLIHFNARSLLKNFNAIISCVKNLNVNFDIIAGTETWLEDSDTNTFDIDGYQVVVGCSIYVINVVKFNIFKPLCTSCHDVFECVAIEVQTKSRNIIVGCVYRPTGGSISEFNHK